MRESFSSGRQWILILAGIAVLGALVVVFYQSRSQGIGSDDMQKLMNRLDAMDAKIQEQQQSGGPTMDPWGRGAATGGFRGAGPRLGSQPPAVPTVEQTQQDQARMRRELDALSRHRARLPLRIRFRSKSPLRSTAMGFWGRSIPRNPGQCSVVRECA